MSAAQASRLTKLERRSRGRTLACLSDAELSALIVDLQDVLRLEDEDPDLATTTCERPQSGDFVSEDAATVEVWRAWRTGVGWPASPPQP